MTHFIHTRLKLDICAHPIRFYWDTVDIGIGRGTIRLIFTKEILFTVIFSRDF